MMKAHFASFARYNSWANRLLYDAAVETWIPAFAGMTNQMVW